MASCVVSTAACVCLLLVQLLLVNGSAVQEVKVPHSLPVDPAVNYGPLELIRSQGYPAEEHWVTTVDGYILGMHRIPPTGKNQTKGVFFLQHGLLCSSTNWIVNFPNESLAYILSDHGYDVWMGNIRGNTYSRNHTTLKPDTKEFWNFTFDEHSQKDLPAMLDYVLNSTGKDKLFYVGHSQGTVMGFAGFTFNQSLAKHIQGFFALAPVTTVQYIKGLFRLIADFSKPLSIVLDALTDGEFFPSDEFIQVAAKDICPFDMPVEDLCGDVTFLICGFDVKNLNTSRIPVYYAHTPAGTSVKNTMHFSQEVKSGRFAMYDYGGKEANIRHYGVHPSPAYNVSAIKVPTVLFTGGQDWLADPTDVANLLPKLTASGHLVGHKNIPQYSHLDFVWGMDAAKLVYADLVSWAQKLST